MMACAGIMFTELAGVGPKWFEAGAAEYDIDFLPLLAVEALIMGFLETKRYQGFKDTGSVRTRLCACCTALPLRMPTPVCALACVTLRCLPLPLRMCLCCASSARVPLWRDVMLVAVDRVPQTLPVGAAPSRNGPC